MIFLETWVNDVVALEAGCFRVEARDNLMQVFGGGNRYVRLGKSDSDNALFDLTCLSRRRLRNGNF